MQRASKTIEKPVVLVGMMGAGKSTVGRRLAKRLALPFADSDAEIEAQAGRTVSELVERFGEARFRDEERRVIARLLEAPPCIIATGGGAFADPGIRALILERGIAVWLDVEVETLLERVGDGSGRPLLDGKDPHEALRKLAEARRPAYAEAHIMIRGDDPVERILAALAA